MRRNRRGGTGLEFGGSGEDSFVAVVVTKLTGALLFILLLAMVIMALLPKAADLDQVGRDAAHSDATGLASRSRSRHPAPCRMRWQAALISSRWRRPEETP